MTSNRDRLRVLHLVPLPPPMGGMATYALGLLNSPLAEAFDLRAVSVYALRKDLHAGWRRKLLNAANFVLVTWGYAWRMLTFRPAVVHVQTNSGMGLFEKAAWVLLARLTGRRTVLQMHGGGFRDWYQRSGRVRRWCIRRGLKLADHLIVASPTMYEAFQELGLGTGRVSRIGNAVTPPDEKQLGHGSSGDGVESEVRVLFLNRVTVAKGAFDLLDAVARLQSRRPGLRLRLVGLPEADGGLAERAGELGIADVVEIVGPVSEQAKVEEYRRADIYVLPSHVEDLPYGVLESMSFGLAVVASAVGGIPSIIQDGINGLLVPPWDPDALATVLDRLAADPELRGRMGAAARRTIIGEYSWTRRAKQIGTVYCDLIGTGQAAA